MSNPSGTPSTTADDYLWVGVNGESWDAAGDWEDTTTATDPAPYVPGTLTAATITGPTGSTTEAIRDGGSAASLALTGSLNLSGNILISGALTIGSTVTTPATTDSGASTTLLSGSLSASGVIETDSISLLEGTLSLAGTADLSSTGPILIGSEAAYDSATGTYATTLDLAAGAKLSTMGDLSTVSGTLNDVDATMSIGGSLNLGEVEDLYGYSYFVGSAGSLSISSGGSLSVAGAFNQVQGLITVDGQGSKLIVDGAFTAETGSYYSYGGFESPAPIIGSLAVVDGAFAQLGRVVLDAPPQDSYSPAEAGIYVDATSSMEIGTTGAAAAGTITIDATKAITVNTSAILSGNLVDNGTLTINSGSLGLSGTLSGNGTIAVEANGTVGQSGNMAGNLLIDIGDDAAFMTGGGTAAAGDTIDFVGTGGELFIGTTIETSTGTAEYPLDIFDADIKGFQAGDSIVLAQSVTAATYTAASGSGAGTLVLTDGTATVETLTLTGDFSGDRFVVSSTPGSASITVASKDTNLADYPVATGTALAVTENPAATPIGIAAPTDPNYSAAQLTITVTGLPTDGTVTLADGIAVTTGMLLSSDELTGLELASTTGNFAQSSSFTYAVADPVGNVSTGTATLQVVPALGDPVVAAAVLAVAENAASTAIGIVAPTDPNYVPGKLAVTATGLPTNGTVTLADGTAVTAGMLLSSAQLSSLRFTPTAGQFGQSSSFTYSVADPAGNAATSAATLRIGPALGNPVVPATTLTVIEDATATAIGIAAPSDPNYNTAQLTITATALPTDGTVTLADGTVVTAGMQLSSAQLSSLQFTPTAGDFSHSSSFTYSVADPAGNAATGTATLNIGTNDITFGSGAQKYSAAANTTIQLTDGNDTITAAAGNVTVGGGSGQLFFAGGIGSSLVSGGSGSATILGGAGGGQFTGGSAGQNILVSQGSAGSDTTLTGVAAGDVLFGSAPGNDYLDAGQGRESIIGGGGDTTITGGNAADVIFTGGGNSTVFDGTAGGDIVVGGAGSVTLTAQKGDAVFGGTGALSVSGSTSGADSILGGSGSLVVNGRGGNMLVVAGTSTSQIHTGNGASLIFGSSGNTTLTGGNGSMQVLLGSGNLLIGEGAGPASYDVVNGLAGGTAAIFGFRPGIDKIDLFGYSQSGTHIATGSGSTLISLSDGTKIELVGVSSIGNSVIG